MWSQYDHRRPQASAKGALTTPYKIEKCYRIQNPDFTIYATDPEKKS